MDNAMSGEGPPDPLSSVSLGMTVLDELHFPGKPPLTDVVGGSGAYSTSGARLVAGAACSGAAPPRSIACLVLTGKDFPETAEGQLREWNATLVLHKDPESFSTRGLLEYEDTTFGQKKFRYTTDPLKTTPAHLRTHRLLHARAFHILATSQEVIAQIPELLSYREASGITERPLLIWEPLPASCQPFNYHSVVEACKLIDFFSPNHLEMGSLCSDKVPEALAPEQCEVQAITLLHLIKGQVNHGCVILPAFYAANNPEVIDPTGAGNAFLGGFAMGMQINNSLYEAACYGSVAASFALEQVGVPRRETSGVYGCEETWNGTDFNGRYEVYRGRCQMFVMLWRQGSYPTP